MSASVRGVYVITDTRIQQRFNHVELTRMAAEGGASMVQFREKDRAPAEMLTQIRRMQSLCRDYECTCIVNDRVDLMMAATADGVHVGQDDLPIPRVRSLVGERTIIGGTASTLNEAMQVEEEGADYVGFGHIFETRTKTKTYAPRGLKILNEVTDKLEIPVMAIGGITAENAGQVMEAGAAGFVVTSAVCLSEKPTEAVKQLVRIFQQSGVE